MIFEQGKFPVLITNPHTLAEPACAVIALCVRGVYITGIYRDKYSLSAGSHT